jgi:hypothetical protein
VGATRRLAHAVCLGWAADVAPLSETGHVPTMSEDENTFVAEHVGPPRRRYWIARDPPATANDQTRGWSFVYDEMQPDGTWAPRFDTREEWFFEILRYPPEYAQGPLTWRRLSDNEAVDLSALQRRYDGKSIASQETPESAGLRPPGSQ